MDDEKPSYLGFSAFPGIGPLRFKLLLDYFGSAKAAWEAPKSELVKIGLGVSLSEQFARFRATFNLRGYEERLKALSIAVITLTDERYPKLLREIPNPPFLLYLKGKKIKNWDLERSIAVVGTRQITNYGKEVTRRLVTELVDYGITIVSGLALGIDAAAHEAAIESSGKTIAVLGCGVDCCNPRSNQHLYDRIVAGFGMVISEFPLSLQAAKGLFPARNRMISGLSLGTVVIEGAEDSGALITASYAAEQGREVFAVPGPITSPYSRAPTKLLKQGAKLVTSASDILEELKIANQPINKLRITKKGDNEEEQRIIDLLGREPMGADVIIRLLQWETAKVMSTLSILEIKSIVKNEGGVYILI